MLLNVIFAASDAVITTHCLFQCNEPIRLARGASEGPNPPIEMLPMIKMS